MNKCTCDITVIIPVYNVEAYLQECLDSFWVDTPLNIELLAIDDSSTDGSLAILRRNARAHSNLKIIECDQNMGVSAARNMGAALAGGKYLYFCDSDDTLDFRGIEALYRIAEEDDLDVALGYRYEMVEDTGEKRYVRLRHKDTGTISGKEYFHLSATDKLQGIGPWQSLYRRDFMLGNRLLYLYANDHQDNELMPRVMLAAQRVRQLDLPFYCHRIRSGTLSSSTNYERKMRARLEILGLQQQLLRTHFHDPRLRLSLRNMMARNLAELIKAAAMLPSRERSRMLKTVRRAGYIRDAIHSTRRRAKFFALCAFISLELTCAIYGLYAKRRKSG